MPRFYLHACNGSGFIEDEEGTDVADAAAAREKAVEGLRDWRREHEHLLSRAPED
jgi:hypothetical protein